ncbi:MAG: hypothetical protein WD226_02880, partial [Planctomycetota bacterium]
HLDELGVLARLRWQRVRLAVREFGFQLVLGAWAAAFGLVATAAAAWLFVAGLAGAVSDLFDEAPWVGPLLTGFVILALTPLVLFWLRRRHRSRFARQLVERFEPDVVRKHDPTPSARTAQARHAR